MSELATYSIEMKLEGMMAPSQPAGAGDRSLRFELKIDATDPGQANEVWYEHIEAMFGPDEVARLRTAAANWAQSRR